jgi:CHAT domain-containing protein
MPNPTPTVRLRLPGRVAPPTPATQSHADIAGFLKVQEKTAVSVGVSLRGAPVETFAFDAQPDDVVELEYEGGLYQWVRVDQLRDDLKGRNLLLSRGAGDEEELVIPPDLGNPVTRGAVDVLLKGLKILGIDPVGAAADLAVRAVVSKFEDSLQPAPGLYVLSDPRTPERPVRDAKELDNRAPYLLFLHGTASSIAGSFGGLAPSPDDTEELIPPDDWEALRKRYPGRILGLQHKTLSVSPVTNALDAARLLPEGAQLHLVSHSRGGLIGELLCLGELPKDYTGAFAKVPGDVPAGARQEVLEARREEAERIDQLSAELGRKRFAVQRFVRVACPARGTVLASRRLDLYLSVLLNVIGLIPVLKASPLYALLKAVTMETAHRRADPRQMPGIEAMMPESPLINLLNQKDLTSAADLAVIAGDLAPEGVWQRLKTLAVELFYLQANDLVVNTSAMYGGMERRATASYFFNKGPHVNHFHYFRNTGTRGLMRKWLEAGKGDAVEGFRKFVPSQTEFVADTRRAADAQEPRAVVFVVPDFMGTEMKDDAGEIWPNLSGLAKRGLDRLASADGTVKPGELIAGLYAPLVNRLQQQYRVEPVGYDWRKGVEEIANALRSRVQTVLADQAFEKQPLHFVAHGAGALGVLKLAADTKVWGAVAARNGRVVLLGAPPRGYPAITQLTLADGRLNRLLQMSDHQSETAPEKFFAGLQSVADLRPGGPATLGLADAANVKNTFAVIGKSDRTVCGIRDDQTVLYTSAGDGLVTSEAARMEGVPTWQVDAPHGMLGRHDLLAESIVELIAQGSVSKLARASNAPPLVDAEPLPMAEPLFFPTEDDLLDAALGGKPPSQFETVDNPIRVSVSHGHLRQAKFPVMVGHYQDDTIVSAEKELDRQFGGRLTQRFNMGVYPGRVGTLEVVLAPGCSPTGALVIGLGEVGELTPEKLRRGVRAALVRYAVQLAEEARTEATGPRGANVSALLMGTYGQGSVREAVSAVIHGALDANRQLGEQQLLGQVRVQEIELIEMYEDIATEAVHELLTLAERLNGDATAGAVLAAEPLLRVLEGGRTSRPANQYAAGWWRRIKIGKRVVPNDNQSDGLTFTVLTDRARAEDYVRGTQRQVLDPMLQAATRRPLWDEQLSTVLFQLLIPRRLRSYAQDRVNMVLVVDEDAANYPWELLAQRTRAGVEALAVQCGLLRQLQTSSAEERMPPASGSAALVVGDSESGWADLPGARAEAEAVHGRLSGARYDSLLLSKKDGMTIVNALLSRELRIVHLAGHGNFDPKNPEQSGMKIGPDQWLTPDILDGMLAAPDLVFVNCCHLGVVEGAKEGTPSPQLAASFAVKLMNLGAKAVIAAGWAVHDGAARTFAERFYQRMLDGDRFGDAVLDARQRAKELYPQINTWGAYQCYGNPDFRLDGGSGTRSQAARTQRFVARQEILQRLNDIAAQASAADAKGLLAQLEDLREQTPAQWRDGEVLAAFGNAYAELGRFEEAISAYRQALADEQGKAPLRAAQQIANLLDRRAKQMTGEQQKELRKEAMAWLDKVEPLADTAELAALRAGYFKRAGDRENALLTYQRSADLQKRVMSDGFYYPGLNAAAIAFILGAKDPDKWGQDPDKWRQEVRACADAAARQREVKRDVWSRAGVVDAALMMALWDNDLDRKQSDLGDEYIRVIEGGGAERERDSILGQIAYLTQQLPPDHPAQAPLTAILNRVRARFGN